MSTRSCLKLSNVATLYRCTNVRPSGDPNDTQCEKHPEITISDFDRMGVCTRAVRKTAFAASPTARRRANAARVRDGDILISIRGGTGFVGFVEKPSDMIIGGQQFIIIRLRDEYKDKLTPEYLFRYLRSRRLTEIIDSRKTGKPHLLFLKTEAIRSLPVVMPDQQTLKSVTENFKRQRDIYARVSDAEQEIAGLDEQSLALPTEADVSMTQA
jgi:hypothetical protein